MAEPNSKDYTVGWICAILPEYIAAQECLDKEYHIPLSVHAGDKNTYTLGAIGPHKAVITILPDGEYGTDSAARVAANMLSSFPNIRIGLMVGIGGGAPNEKNDIRLGDVVVSVPRDGHSGVFQYDFGKTIQGEMFQHTRLLNQPPQALRSAVSQIRALHKRKGHRIQKQIAVILEGNPRLQNEFGRPDPSEDQLFKSDIIYDATRIPSKEDWVFRCERTSIEDDPAIHYGTIASANQLMKDAILRDKLAAERNIMCFEMEAAGLMNQFPCLVIRGICDYADSYKNKKWQGYAALTAAVFAKDLIMTISPEEVESQNTLKYTVEIIKQDLKNLATVVEENEKKEILDWLANNTHSLKQARLCDLRHRGTGQWFLDSVEFKDWETGCGKVLYCPGVSGVGKTVMASIVIDHLFSTKQKENAGIAYIYFDYAKKEEQNLSTLLAGLLRQLASFGDAVENCVKQLYENRTKAARPTLNTLSNALDSVAGKFERVFLVVDALDECYSPQCRKEFMQVLLGLQSRLNANVLITSLPDPKITRILQDREFVVKDIVSSSEDVESYLSSELRNMHPELINEGQISLDAYAREIFHYADGIFLIAKLYMNILHDMDISSHREFQQTLDELQRVPKEVGSRKPELLKRLYAKTMQRIQGRSEDAAVHALMFVTCATRQMTSRELHSALTIATSRENETTIPKESTNDFMTKVLSLCLGLLIIDPATSRVRFFHSTASEYFNSTRDAHFAEADTEMTKACLACLSKVTPPHTGIDRDAFDWWVGSDQFYGYAASFWGHHACATSKCLDHIMEFLGHHDSVDLAGSALVHGMELPEKFLYIDNPEMIAGFVE
ncbi:hypothetical protein FVER53590_30333 [Fusarium verticillioides]|nr:hypothetical protein FVER53590_30333 [Fusarium verticillioides]